RTGSYVYSAPTVDRGRFVFGSYNGVFYAVRASNGATLWAHRTGGPISGAAVVVAGVAYAGSFAHRIIGIDARTGKVVLSFPHGEYVPVSGRGRRLLLHGYSRLWAVEHRRGESCSLRPPPSCWPRTAPGVVITSTSGPARPPSTALARHT